MVKISQIKGYEMFIEECRFFFCNDIYENSWQGKERFIVASDTPEAELKERYPEIMKALEPYIYCNAKCGTIFQDGKRNDEKFKKRALCNDSIDLESDESMILSDSHDMERDVLTKLIISEALDLCTPTQKERIIKYYFDGLTFDQIANGKDKKIIRESVKSGLKKIKNFLE